MTQGTDAKLSVRSDADFLAFCDRLSDSPFIERVWRCHSERAGVFESVAAGNFEMVVTRYQGKASVTLRGPETKATTADCPSDGEWLGIRFKLGAFMPQLPPGRLRDRHDFTAPSSTERSFWLSGCAWEYPDFENAETFVERLARSGLLVRDAIVEAALQNHETTLSTRSAQRHFLRATGISHAAYRNIERARHAAILLKQGIAIPDVVHQAGYFDQAHLTRSVKHLMGKTPGSIARRDTQLSFLYKTNHKLGTIE